MGIWLQKVYLGSITSPKLFYCFFFPGESAPWSPIFRVEIDGSTFLSFHLNISSFNSVICEPRYLCASTHVQNGTPGFSISLSYMELQRLFSRWISSLLVRARKIRPHWPIFMKSIWNIENTYRMCGNHIFFGFFSTLRPFVCNSKSVPFCGQN